MQFIFILIPFVFTTSAVINILLGVEGDTWNSSALNYIFLAAIILNILGYIALKVNYSKWFLYTNIVITFLIFYGILISAFGCFPNTGSRYSNCNADIFAWLAIINSLIIFLGVSKRWLHIISLTLIIFPITTLLIHYYITSPLWNHLKTFDFSKTCIIYGNTYDQLNKYNRMKKFDDLTLKLFISESSPRIIRITNNEQRIWEYSKRQFGRSKQFKKIPDPCR
ncbi:MAG: hypothetical protein ACRBBJ_15190 [Rhodomicrobiaceae bacterium]